MERGHVYSILIENWDEEITGVFLAEGKEWVLLFDNQNDFMLDGYRFIRKEMIDEILREEDELFKEKIFALKYPNLNYEYSFKLDSIYTLLCGFQNNNTLLYFDGDDEEEIVVGKIEEVYLKNFKIKPLNSFGKWGESIDYDFSEITSISIQNDYLSSFGLLL